MTPRRRPSSAFLRSLEARLPKPEWTAEVDVQLDPLGMSITRAGAVKIEEHRGTEVFRRGRHEPSPWLVIGEPGSGKTTLLTTLARDLSRERRWAFFIPMASFDPNKSVETQCLAAHQSLDELVVLRDAGRAFFIIDAVDEARLEDIDNLFEHMLLWAQPVVDLGNTVVMSCRTAEVPAWVHTRVAEARLLPVPDDEIDRLFENARAKRGKPSLEADPLDGLYSELREMCRNPLLLMMALYLYQSGGIEGLHGVKSRATLYRYFFDELTRWDRRKRPPMESERAFSPAFREAVYAEVGYRMHETTKVSVRDVEVQLWVANALRERKFDHLLPVSYQPTSEQLFQFISSRPPLSARPQGPLGGLEFRFLHQTFGDVFAAIYLNNSDSPLAECEHLIRATSRRHWDIIVPLCGLLDAPELLTQRIASLSFEDRRQDLLLLASRCIRDRWDMPQSESDDLSMRILEAFKYWDAFDYQLIHALRHLRPSGQFPRRLRRDVSRFIEKYANYIPEELGNTSINDLLRYLSSQDLQTACNAAFSLGQQESRLGDDTVHVVLALQLRAQGAVEMLHEQITAALKALASPLSREWFENVCRAVDAPERSKAFALNGLGRIGDIRSIEVVTTYLNNHKNKYRDSASWSLQMLAKVAAKKDSHLFSLIKRGYVEALQAESDDIEGVFAKGNILYSLGVLGANEYVSEITSVIETEDDAYVVEDGINALGLLGQRDSIDFLRRFLDYPDPIVRMKAADALLRIAPKESARDAERLVADRHPIVRDVIRIRLADLDFSPDIYESTTLRDSFANPQFERDIVTVQLLEQDAKRVEELAEQLLRQREIATRPKFFTRSGFSHARMSKEAFLRIKTRLEEIVRGG